MTESGGEKDEGCKKEEEKIKNLEDILIMKIQL